MSETMKPRTEADETLLRCLPEQVARLRESIKKGRPYVWALRLSLADFKTLEAALKNSIYSHNNDHCHLLCGEYAVTVVMYLAEWYKRFYKGTETDDSDKVLSLDTEELKTLYKQANIDIGTFVYNASKNPDRTSFRWLESLQVLGGLAVREELRRDEQDDPLLPQLCRLFHGEELDLDDMKDRERAVAFQESISRKHSLYEYLACILGKGQELPFAKSDLRDESTMIPELLRHIALADRKAKKEKFDFEWIIYYNASQGLMTRHLRVKPKPEEIGGGLRQYIGYDRLRKNWGVEHPENIGRIRFYLRFKCEGICVKDENCDQEPLFKYDNTGSETTGFLSVNRMDESICTNVPVCPFDKVELVMRHDNTAKVVQTLEVQEYMQVYALRGEGAKFSNRRNSQAMTAVVFSTAYHLVETYKDLPLVYARYVNGGELSKEYCWCPINDKVVIEDDDGREVKPPFFNRNGLFQVVTRKYPEAIKYRDNAFVRYLYKDPDFAEEDEQEAELPVLFGSDGLEVRHYLTANSSESEQLTTSDYILEWRKNNRYVEWETEEPKQGAVWLRAIVQGREFRFQAFYVPFSPTHKGQPPIWRNFENHRICTALDGVEDIQDDFRQSLHGDERAPGTRELVIGNENERICLDIYRPYLLRELTHKTENVEHGGKVEYCSPNEDVEIPLVNCDQFSLRVFSEIGVREYELQKHDSYYYSFPLFKNLARAESAYLIQRMAKELMPDVPLECLKLYISRTMDNSSGLYAWNYMDAPQKICNPPDFRGTGIIFQSLLDNASPRHYLMPKIRPPWGGWRNLPTALEGFETAVRHGTYFFLFDSLIKSIAEDTQIGEIILPFIAKRNNVLTEADMVDLCRFAAQFHFDWMLLPRRMWLESIEHFAADDEQRQALKEAVMDFFASTTKCTDDAERSCLKDFLRKYWSFDYYQNIKDPLAKKALDLICDAPEIQEEKKDMGNFLKDYDKCRHKFLEMSKAVCSFTTSTNV